MDRATEQRHFEMAARHIAELEDKIGAQEAMLTTLDRNGHDTTQAQRLLDNFRDLLVQARVHKGRITEALSRSQEGGPV